MSLTSARGPLGPDPAGSFNVPLPPGIVYVEPFGRRVRGIVDGRTAIDTERALLVHRPGRPPTLAFPAGDVGGVEAREEAAAAGHVSVAPGAVDAWYEEDELLQGHPRNPYHRVDCLRTSRRVRVELAGEVLVDTTETVGVYETSLRPRLYVRPAAVRLDLLARSDTTTYCPYKGHATYWHATAGGQLVADVAWSYDDPFPECLPITGMLCFDEQRVPVVAELDPDR